MPGTNPSKDEILSALAAHNGSLNTRLALASPRGGAGEADAIIREAYMLVARKWTIRSWTETRDELGWRSHTTCMDRHARALDNPHAVWLAEAAGRTLGERGYMPAPAVMRERP